MGAAAGALTWLAFEIEQAGRDFSAAWLGYARAGGPDAFVLAARLQAHRKQLSCAYQEL
jgi:hypothetical protein